MTFNFSSNDGMSDLRVPGIIMTENYHSEGFTDGGRLLNNNNKAPNESFDLCVCVLKSDVKFTEIQMNHFKAGYTYMNH